MKFDPAELIINRPDLLNPGHKLTAWGITLFFWGMLLYLWQPLLSLLAWGLNIRLFYNHMILLGGYRTFLDSMFAYLQIITLMGGGLIVWARINQWRFRGKERRQSLGDTNLQELQVVYGVTAVEVAAAANAQIVKFTFAANGKTGIIETNSASITQADPAEKNPLAKIVSVSEVKLVNQFTNPENHNGTR